MNLCEISLKRMLQKKITNRTYISYRNKVYIMPLLKHIKYIGLKNPLDIYYVDSIVVIYIIQYI